MYTVSGTIFEHFNIEVPDLRICSYLLKKSLKKK